MIFKGLRKFAGNEMIQVFRYLSVTLADFARDLSTGLSRLTFRENFECFTQDVSMEHSAQLNITNRFKTTDIDVFFMNNTQPFQVFFVTKDLITIENYGGIAATATVLVFKR